MAHLEGVCAAAAALSVEALPIAIDEAHRRRLLRLFRVSVLKQRKWEAIRHFLGKTEGLNCLDIGSDNGVISTLLRRQGGSWVSADLDAQTVNAIRAVVGQGVFQLTPESISCKANAFDRVVLIDCLEHVADDGAFASELLRVTKPGGVIIVNVPLKKESWLRRFRLAIGQTDEAHGHLRPGYRLEEIRLLFGSACTLEQAATYSKFFSEAIDTLMTWAIRKLKPASKQTIKGTVVTGSDLKRYGAFFWLYVPLYPLLWLFAQLDRLLWQHSGYMLIARLRVNDKAEQ